MSGMFGGGGSNPYDEIVAKTTDENLTSENWELILNLCDKVQDEGSDGARSVIASLLKRFSHRNPNVQLYTLSLADALSKNVGLTINREIASRTFTAGLEKLVVDRNTHDKVRKRVLALIKEWTEEWEGQDDLGIMEECYMGLKNKNYKFETIDEPPPPVVDDEIRRREEEELQRVLEMSLQDRGGYNMSSWTQPNGDGARSSNGTVAPGYVPSTNPSAASCYAPATSPPSHEFTHGPSSSSAATGSSMSLNSSSTSTSSSSSTKKFLSNRVRALHTFTPTEPGELGFSSGDIITVVDRNYKDWWRGQLRGRTGIFPVNYVELLPPPDPTELAREAQQEAAIFAEATNVERLLEMLRELDSQVQSNGTPSRLADNDELQELYRSCMALRPKIVKLIDKYSQKRADLVSMNETFVRARGIFERLMEESLAGVYPPPNVYAGYSSTATPSYGGSQPGYFPTPSPYSGAPYPGPVQGPVQSPIPTSPSSRVPQTVPPAQGLPQIVGTAQAHPISAYEALYGSQRASVQASGSVLVQQTYAQQQPGRGQTPQQAVQSQVSIATQPQPLRHLSQSPQQPQSQSQRRQSPQSQKVSGPPYIFNPSTTYSDPNVQAWAHYYAQGGTDPTGAVYFVSVPGVKEAEGVPRNDRGTVPSEQISEIQKPVQTEQAEPITQARPSDSPTINASYGASPYPSIGTVNSANTTSSSILPYPSPGPDPKRDQGQITRSSTVDSSLSTTTAGSLPNPYADTDVSGGIGDTGNIVSVVPGLTRSSSSRLPYPGDTTSSNPVLDSSHGVNQTSETESSVSSPHSPHGGYSFQQQEQEKQLYSQQPQQVQEQNPTSTLSSSTLYSGVTLTDRPFPQHQLSSSTLNDPSAQLNVSPNLNSNSTSAIPSWNKDFAHHPQFSEPNASQHHSSSSPSQQSPPVSPPTFSSSNTTLSLSDSASLPSTSNANSDTTLPLPSSNTISPSSPSPQISMSTPSWVLPKHPNEKPGARVRA